MNRIKDYKQLAEDISNWIKDYAIANNIKSLVVGVSGGIDSAVVSTLCAMTGVCTELCVIDIDSNQQHIYTAEEHCKQLESSINVHYNYFDMSKCFDAFVDETVFHAHLHGYANSKSRLRMTALYQIASATQGIVVGTGNKVEDFGVGFYTKYGDGGVDISPIADLYKTEVYELGRYLGISQEILDAAPTDGLWSDGRTDEQQIGATYEELEWVMEWIERGDEVLSIGSRKDIVMRRYLELNKQNKHKMLPILVYKVDKHI